MNQIQVDTLIHSRFEKKKQVMTKKFVIKTVDYQ